MRIELFKVRMSEKAPEEVGKVLMSGFIGQGPKVEEFEEVLKKHFGLHFINTVNSCTSGLELVVHMIKNEEACEIITTPLTCTATNTAIVSRGVKLVWADIDPKTCNIDLDDVARKITSKTKAIILVHWGGNPVDLDKLREIQLRAFNTIGTFPIIIEDCAHAWGAKYKDKYIGTYGNFAIFSFQAIKHLTTGDGGIILSPNEEYHQRAKLLRWYGLDRTNNKDFRCEQNIQEAGFKFHMNDISATIGICNYQEVDSVVAIHKNNGKFYNENLMDIPGVKLIEIMPNSDPSYWIYTIMVENRDGFFKKMKEYDIHVSQVHDRNDKHRCFRNYKSILPGLDEVSKKMICIPCGWWVSKKDREYVVDAIKNGW
jgi:dTDP-4-amino-4,6-dideoxygalactose transaminase